MVALILILGAVASQLAAAHVSISIEEDRARVTSSYRLTPLADSVTYSAIRLSGQSIAMDEGLSVSHSRSLPGLDRLVSNADSGAEQIDTIVYDLVGDVRRVALFVPDVAAAPGPRVVAIEVRGVDHAAALTDAFPRLQWIGDTLLTAEMSDMPSFVRIPGTAGAIGANRLADLAAVAVVALATLYWIIRRASRS